MLLVVLAGNQKQGGPVKISVVGGGRKGSKIWRQERIEMSNDPDLDDVAFLSGMFFFSSVVSSSSPLQQLHTYV